MSAGCRSHAPAPAASDSPLAGQAISGGPTSFAQVAPGDTAALIGLMRLTMTQIDSALDEFERRDTVMATSPDSEPRRLSVWLQHGIPRKLAVSEPDQHGAMTGESDFWFVDGDVAVVLQGASAFALDAGRIVLWTDEVLVPRTEFTDADRMARETGIREEVERYLAQLGVKGGG